MKRHFFLLLCLLCFENFLNAQDYQRLKVSFNYDSTGNIYFNDMAVDRSGNTYLAGYETLQGDEYYQTHFYLLKINAAGIPEWKRSFNNLKDSIDEAIALAVDSAGYVYVTGRRIDTFCNICTYRTKLSDIITIKYDGAGNRIWLNRYHDSALILAKPSAIALGPGGTILITGNESRYVSEWGTYINNLLIQKINKNGKTVWVRKQKDVVGNAGCFDKDKNIIIVGASDPSNYYLGQKPVVLKYSAGGRMVWSTIFDEPYKNGRLHAVQCDSLNNIYVSGQTDTMTFYNIPRIVTIKYNSLGQVQWYRKEVNRTTYSDFKTDASGNCYITGYINKSGIDDDWLTVKYDNKGRKKWEKTYDDQYHASDKPVALALDSKKNVFVCGYVYHTGGNYAIATVGYSKTGDSLFADIYSRNKSNGFASGIGVDKYNNIYAGGIIRFYNKPYPAYTVIKYGIKKVLPVAEKPAPVINELKLFPNPVSNSLYIDFNTSLPAKNYDLKIVDVNGNIVLSMQLKGTGNKIIANVDVSGLKAGIYTANIYSGVNSVSKIFIKE